MDAQEIKNKINLYGKRCCWFWRKFVCQKKKKQVVIIKISTTVGGVNGIAIRITFNWVSSMLKRKRGTERKADWWWLYCTNVTVCRSVSIVSICFLTAHIVRSFAASPITISIDPSCIFACMMCGGYGDAVISLVRLYIFFNRYTFFEIIPHHPFIPL